MWTSNFGLEGLMHFETGFCLAEVEFEGCVNFALSVLSERSNGASLVVPPHPLATKAKSLNAFQLSL